MLKLKQTRITPDGVAFYAAHKPASRRHGARLAPPAHVSWYADPHLGWGRVVIATPNRPLAVARLLEVGYAPTELDFVTCTVTGPYPTRHACDGIRLPAPSRTAAARWAGCRLMAVHSYEPAPGGHQIAYIVVETCPYEDGRTVEAHTGYKGAEACASALSAASGNKHVVIRVPLLTQ